MTRNDLPSRRAGSALRGAFSLSLLALFLALAALSRPASGAGFSFTTDNDILTDNRTEDDLYSYGLGLSFARGPWTVALQENGFTDRAAGLRFEETFLTVARDLEIQGWDATLEAGAVRVGRGVLDQSFQNSFHDLIGGDPVHLAYVDEERLFAVARATARRRGLVTATTEVGPYFAASLAPGFKSHALAAVEAQWRPRGGPLSLAARVGARASTAHYQPLEDHVGGFALHAALAAVYRDRLVLGWILNPHGTEREHVTLGWRVGTGGFPFSAGS